MRFLPYRRKRTNRTAGETYWNQYEALWTTRFPGLPHLGDEWAGVNAGVAQSVDEYSNLIETELIVPNISSSNTVLEIGVGGGKTTELLLKHCAKVIGADVSERMLRRTAQRLDGQNLELIKLNGVNLDSIPESCADVLFTFDTFVHINPRTIYRYLADARTKLRGGKVCIIHHSNILTQRGWETFIEDTEAYEKYPSENGGLFSVMTEEIMRHFFDVLGYDVLEHKDIIPRDSAWICRAP